MSNIWLGLFALLALFLLAAGLDSLLWYSRHRNDEYEETWEEIYKDQEETK